MTGDPADLPVAILAGGLATRLRPVTDTVPKLLLEVGDEPFFAHQLRLLKTAGLRRIVACVGHLGEQIVDRFGGGSQFGVDITYSFDGPRLLGTGGALLRALPLLGPSFYVLYGDSYLPIDYLAVGRTFLDSGKPGLMTVYENRNQFDASNVIFRDGQIVTYSKRSRTSDMRHIDYGLGVLQASVFDAYAPETVLDLADIYEKLAADGQLAGFETSRRFYEIGSHQGLMELDAFLRTRSTTDQPRS